MPELQADGAADLTLGQDVTGTLRDRAEATFATDDVVRPDDAAAAEVPAAADDVAVLPLAATIHELRVHQVELEMQNEELRRTEAHLVAANIRYLDLYDRAPVAFLTFNGAGVILEANRTAATLLVRPRDEILGSLLSSFVVPEDKDVLYLHTRQLFATGDTPDFEVRLAAGTLEPRWASIHAVLSPNVDAGGRPAARASLLDRTDAIEVEARTRRAAEHLRVQADAARAFAEIGAASELLCERLVEHAGAALGDACFLAMVSHDHPQLDIAAVHAALPELGPALWALGSLPCEAGDRPCPFGKVVQTRDSLFVPVLAPSGKPDASPVERWAFEAGLPVRSLMAVPLEVLGHQVGVVIVVRVAPVRPSFVEDDLLLFADLVDRAGVAISRARLRVSTSEELARLAAAEAALTASEERLRVALDTMLEGVSVLASIRDRDGGIEDFRIEYSNEAIGRISGVLPADQVGHTLLELFPAHRHNGLFDAYVRVVETGIAYESGIVQYVDPDAAGGALDQVLEHAAARVGDGYVLSVRDVSARKAAEDEINRLNADLELRVAARTAGLQAANAELQTFSYTVSHDLRSPLRAMTGFAELLARREADRLDERSRHYLANIVEGGERMSQLIEELLDYSRLGRSHVQAEPVSLGPVLEGIRQAMAGQIRATDGALVVVEPLAVPVADPVLLERMLVNLLDNAFVYRRPGVGPVVTVSAVRHGQRVTLAVADNGIGIPAEYQDKVFEPFVRLHRADEYPGTGIGLATVRKAAALLDSAVRVESTVGVGSTFSLDLPAAE